MILPFAKPGASAPYDAMGEEAVKLALADAGLGYDAIERAYGSFVYGDFTAGQKVLSLAEAAWTYTNRTRKEH